MGYISLENSFVPSAVAYSVSFIALLLGSVTDLKTREVPDWLNYGLVFSGISLNLLFSVIYSDSSFIINSIIGLVIFFGIAYIMFYSGQWGGGDSKMIMGLGSMLGINLSLGAKQFIVGFLLNALFAGALYGLLWSIFLVVKNKKKFSKQIKKEFSNEDIAKTKRIVFGIVILSLVLAVIAKIILIKILILSFSFIVVTAFYLWVFVKAIEKSCMHRLVEPSKLTEGDWIVNDVYVNKEYICGPKDLGIEKRQIKRLIELHNKGKIKKILIKEGIPFVPSFLIAFIVTFLLGNPLAWIL